MDNLINETNQRLQDIIDNLTTIRKEYENKLGSSNKEIEIELGKVKKYKEDFFVAKQKIEKMNSDIEGFEADYQNLVDRFKDDELANILIAANKEISAKIDERKRKIARDKIAMNDLVEKAELSKDKLVKLTAEKRALELCLAKILDSYEFYTKAISQIIEYSKDNAGNLAACFHEKGESIKLNFTKNNEDEDFTQEKIEEALKEDYIIEDNVLNEENDNDDITVEEIENENKKEDSKDEKEVNLEVSLIEDEDDEKIEIEEIKLDEDDITPESDEKAIEDETVKENSKKGSKKRTKKDKKENKKEETVDEENKIESDNYTIGVEEIPSSIYNFDDSIEDEKKD